MKYRVDFLDYLLGNANCHGNQMMSYNVSLLPTYEINTITQTYPACVAMLRDPATIFRPVAVMPWRTNNRERTFESCQSVAPRTPTLM